MNSRRWAKAAVAALMMACATPTMADPRLNLGGAPIYGSVHLTSGFAPDPHEISVLPGGDIDASTLAAGCIGYIGYQPDYQLNFQGGGGLNLYVRAVGPVDTALVINGPDGRWHCDDDSAGDLDPEVFFANPRSGRYDIFVATLSAGTADDTVQLQLSEIGLDPVSGSNDIQDIGEQPIYGSVTLRAGFTPDPHQVQILPGGNVASSNARSECNGTTGKAPDYQVTYSAGSSPLIFKVAGQIDTTLLINSPTGEWYCDDDGGQGHNPLVRFNKPATGRYDIWVGDFSQPMDNKPTVTLMVTEMD